jgi:purine-cytosine permease-like protein
MLKIVKVIIQITLIVSILLSLYLLYITKGSNHYLEANMKIRPINFVVFFALMLYFTKFIRSKKEK